MTFLSLSKDNEGRRSNSACVWDMVRECSFIWVTKGLFGQCRDQHLVRSMEEHAARNFSVEELDKMQELGEPERRMNYISLI